MNGDCSGEFAVVSKTGKESFLFAAGGLCPMFVLPTFLLRLD